MQLRPNQRLKLDETDDQLFYAHPRFVTHIDQGFIQRLQDLYRQRLKPNTRIFDLMSSWVSHLPTELDWEHIEGHGLNAAELARNSQLNHYFVQNLNENTQLPLGDATFDAVLNCVSIQYLQYPEAVFTEIHRILKPGGVAIISFSNRMFAQKAIQAWRDATDTTRVELVKSYFALVPGFTTPEVIVYQSTLPTLWQWLGVSGGDPFYAVIAYRSEA
jgi:SAM-dependent methyltransferase